MAFMRVKCGYCGGKWEVYERNFNEEVNKVCPHCGKEIHDGLWSDVKTVFGEYVDTNNDLVKESTGYNLPLFQVDMISDYPFHNVPFKRRRRK